MDRIKNRKPILYLVIPCYNEEAVLPVTKDLFLGELELLVNKGKIHEDSRILYVDDGSRDRTWEMICQMADEETRILGIRQSRNRGHQNALLAGLMEAKYHCDITISMDCDGQDDVEAAEKMVDAWAQGNEVVYGVRSSREVDTFFKRITAQGFYRFLSLMGAEVVYNHADYRLMSSRCLKEMADYQEVNLFLRGLVPLVGFPSTTVEYARKERMAGTTHYPLKKMIALAMDGITSLSIRPLRLITGLGFILAVFSLLGVIWAFVEAVRGNTVDGWASTMCVVCLMSGIQLLCLGVIGEYVGKIYMETKRRPRYIICDKTPGFPERGQ